MSGEDGAAKAVVQRQTVSVARAMRHIHALEDLERRAQFWLPKSIFEYVSGHAETGAAKDGALKAYDKWQLIPRVLRDVSTRSAKTSLLGTLWSQPFGIAPMGGAAMIAYRGDLAIAAGAAAMNVPSIMSASSLIPLEEVHKTNPQAWFQAYLAGDITRIAPMVDRVAKAGFSTLVVTGDTPALGNRVDNRRNGFSMPMRITPKVLWDSALHPRWSLGVIARTFITHGTPHYENMDAARGPSMFSQNSMRNFGDRDKLCWQHIEAIRRQFTGKLVVKGLLHPDDARIAQDIGCDSIIISNHGGRQLDHAIAPLDALPAMRSAVGPDMPLMIDGGIRNGTDILKALALGADFAFIGRPILYATFLGGEAGVAHALRLVGDEINRAMALIGVSDLRELDRSKLARTA
jgi:L-lactate dehydrogenase (cytochrome)